VARHPPHESKPKNEPSRKGRRRFRAELMDDKTAKRGERTTETERDAEKVIEMMNMKTSERECRTDDTTYKEDKQTSRDGQV
jgi:hypothetical protein